MEHKIYTVDIVIETEEEKNKTQVGTITSEDGIITDVDDADGKAIGWAIGNSAPVGDLYIPTLVEN